MAEEIKQSIIDIGVVTTAVEQKFGANLAITGVAPELSTEPFTTYAESTDNILRFKQHDNPDNDEADLGGLFTFGHTQPVVIEQVIAELGASVDWTVNVVTTAGTTRLMAGTSQYLTITPKWIIMPGESIKITAATPGAGKKSWLRLYARLDQARH